MPALHQIIIKKHVDPKHALMCTSHLSPKHKTKDLKTQVKHSHLNRAKFSDIKKYKDPSNRGIVYVIGNLHDKHKKLEGSGFTDYIKNAYNSVKNKIQSTFSARTDFNNKSTRNLKDYGDKPISKMQIFRTPVASMISTSFNTVSLGKWDELMKQKQYDQIFHLALICTIEGKNIIVEKNEVVNIDTSYTSSNNTQVCDVNLNGVVIAINELINNAIAKVGKENIIKYNSFSNCQNVC